MKGFALRAVVGLIRVAAAFIFRYKRLQDIVVLISCQGDEPSRDILDLASEIKRTQGELRVVVMAGLMERSAGGAVRFAGKLLSMLRQIAAARAVVIDAYCPAVSIPKKRPGQRVVQIWHAPEAIKKFSLQITDTPDGYDSMTTDILCMHRGYDCILCPADATLPFFAEAFGYPRSAFVKYGLPSLDRVGFMRRPAPGEEEAPERIVTRERIYEKYPVLMGDEGKRRLTVVYAPTFRNGDAVDAAGLVSAFEKVVNKTGGLEDEWSGFSFVLKLHPLDAVKSGLSGGAIGGGGERPAGLLRSHSANNNSQRVIVKGRRRQGYAFGGGSGQAAGLFSFVRDDKRDVRPNSQPVIVKGRRWRNNSLNQRLRNLTGLFSSARGGKGDVRKDSLPVLARSVVADGIFGDGRGQSAVLFRSAHNTSGDARYDGLPAVARDRNPRNNPVGYCGDGYFRVIVDKVFPLIDWYSMADIVITDYSGVAVDAAAAGIASYYYIYDIDDYAARRGLNIDLRKEAIGKYAFTDADALAAQVMRDFAGRHNSLDDVQPAGVLRFVLNNESDTGNEVEEEGDLYDYKALAAFAGKYLEVPLKGNTQRLASFIMRLVDEGRPS